jgi:hypothetical protein
MTDCKLMSAERLLVNALKMDGAEVSAHEQHNDDPDAATRRAIFTRCC